MSHQAAYKDFTTRLVKLFAHALIATAKGHEAALVKLQEDIEDRKRQSNFK